MPAKCRPDSTAACAESTNSCCQEQVYALPSLTEGNDSPIAAPVRFLILPVLPCNTARLLDGGTKAPDILYERLRSLLLERRSAYATFPRCFRLSLCFGFCALLSRCSPTAGISRQNGGSTMERVLGTRSAVSQPAHFGGESVRLDR